MYNPPLTKATWLVYLFLAVVAISNWASQYIRLEEHIEKEKLRGREKQVKEKKYVQIELEMKLIKHN